MPKKKSAAQKKPPKKLAIRVRVVPLEKVLFVKAIHPELDEK